MGRATRTRIRLVGAALGGTALLAATALPVAAQDSAADGVGATFGQTTLLSALIGEAGSSPLALALIGELGGTTIDPADGVPTAFESIVPLEVSSSLVPALSGVSTPAVSSSSTGEEDSTSTQQVDLGDLVAPAGVPGLLDGVVNPVQLSSSVLDGVASATAASALADVSALAGSVSLDSLVLDLGGASAPTDSAAARGVQLANLDLLNLGDLLAMLGISLDDLPLDTILGLADGLGLPVPTELTDLLDLQAAVDTAQAALDTAQDELDALVAEIVTLGGGLVEVVCVAATGELATLCAQLGGLEDAVAAAQAALDDAIDAVQDALAGAVAVLDPLLEDLVGASLLSLEGIDLSVLTEAHPTVEQSVADVVAEIGAVHVAGTTLPGVDLVSTVEQVEALADQVTSTLNGLLGGALPELDNLIAVDVLDESTSVTEAGGVISALAEVTGLRLTITPPDVCALLSGLLVQESVDELLSDLPDLPVAPITGVIEGLNLEEDCGIAGGSGLSVGQEESLGVVSALTQPLTVEALSVSQAARWSAAAAPATPDAPSAPATPAGPTLPRTGDSATPLVFGAGLAAAAFLAVTTVRRRLQPAEVTTDR